MDDIDYLIPFIDLINLVVHFRYLSISIHAIHLENSYPYRINSAHFIPVLNYIFSFISST